MSHDLNRRDFIGKTVTAVGAAGAVAAASNGAGDSAATGPNDLLNERGMPCGKIGNLTLSRVILGTNIMGGWAHARDLCYVGPLMRAYNNAFRHGVDFIIVGMLDFQVKSNAQLAKDILSRLRNRDRPWRA